jgi:hypothetical protein
MPRHENTHIRRPAKAEKSEDFLDNGFPPVTILSQILGGSVRSKFHQTEVAAPEARGESAKPFACVMAGSP